MIFQNIQKWLQRNAVEESINYLKHQSNDHMQQQQWDLAEHSLQKIIELDPSHEEAQLTLMKVLVRQKKLNEGYVLFQQLAEQHPNYATEVLRFVEAYEEIGHADKMQEVLYQTIAKYPKAIELRIFLAQRLIENAKVQEALSELQEVLKVDSEHLEAHIGIAYCYIGLGQKTEAMQQAEMLQSRAPEQANEILSAIYENVQSFS